MDAQQIATWATELAQIEDRISETQAELREQRKAVLDELKFLRERARHLLALISGKEHEQLDLPVTPPKREPTAAQLNGAWRPAKVGKHTVFHVCEFSSDDGDAVCGEHVHDRSAKTWTIAELVESGRWEELLCIDCLQSEHAVAIETNRQIEAAKSPAPAKGKRNRKGRAA